MKPNELTRRSSHALHLANRFIHPLSSLHSLTRSGHDDALSLSRLRRCPRPCSLSSLISPLSSSLLSLFPLSPSPAPGTLRIHHSLPFAVQKQLTYARLSLSGEGPATLLRPSPWRDCGQGVRTTLSQSRRSVPLHAVAVATRRNLPRRLFFLTS